jgi:hypothetical protein
MNTHPTVVVRRQTELGSQRFGIYVNGRLVEGGFFSFEAARDAARDYER